MTNHSSNRPSGPGLIFGPGPDGWWDSERVSCPKVLRGEDGIWRMWYYGRDLTFDREITLPSGRVGHAVSKDGITWERVRGPGVMGSVLDPHPDPARFDSAHVGVSDMHEVGDVYWMWYFGGSETIDTARGFNRKGFPLRPGAAVSRDGLNWTRLEGPFDGALLDIGNEESFDRFTVGWPQVIRWADGTWRLYYHTVEFGKGYVPAWAESQDGLRWEKRGPLMDPGPKGRFDDYGVATRQMIRHQGRWLMFYEGCQDVGELPEVDRQIGLAVSDDGLNWERVDGPNDNGSILMHAPKGSGRWDYRMGCPWVVPLGDGSLRMYYIGSNEADRSTGGELASIHQIGMAVSDGDVRIWKRWEA